MGDPLLHRTETRPTQGAEDHRRKPLDDPACARMGNRAETSTLMLAWTALSSSRPRRNTGPGPLARQRGRATDRKRRHHPNQRERRYPVRARHGDASILCLARRTRVAPESRRQADGTATQSRKLEDWKRLVKDNRARKAGGGRGGKKGLPEELRDRFLERHQAGLSRQSLRGAAQGTHTGRCLLSLTTS